MSQVSQSVLQKNWGQRQTLFEKLENLENQVNGAKLYLDKEAGINQDIMKKISKARQESQMWKRKYEKWK